MVRLLVLILTSSNARLCRRAYQSLTQDQVEHGLDVTVKVIVNSTNPKYRESVTAVLPSTVEVIETDSTGKPGRGHNSCLQYFEAHPEYDYLFHLDGDDVVYDTALRALELLIDCEPIFVGSTGLDRLTNVPNNPEQRGRALTYGWYRTSAKTDDDPLVWQKWPPSNPFSLPLKECFTPCRPLLFGRRIFDVPIPIRWSETLIKHDDYLVFLAALENHLRHNVKGIYFCPTTQIYVYNTLNPTSSTKTQHVNYDIQQAFFQEETSDIVYLRHYWDMTFQTKDAVPMLMLPHIPAAEDHKTLHLQKHVVQFALQHVQKGDRCYQDKNYKQAVEWWGKAVEEGMYSGTLFLKLGKTYVNLQQPDSARHYLKIAQRLPKTQKEATVTLTTLEKHDTSPIVSPYNVNGLDLSQISYDSLWEPRKL